MTPDQQLRAVALLAELQTLILGVAPPVAAIPPGGMQQVPSTKCPRCGGMASMFVQGFGTARRVCPSCGWEE